MQVVSGPLGSEKVHFEAPEATRLGKEMESFLAWFDSDKQIDPVLKAGIAHLRFVTIHPFEDGNGRIARAICDMALARADGAPDRYYSLSTQIERERKEYYSQLEKQQRGDVNITDCSGDTALRDITALVERGILVRNEGGGRSTSYRLINR